MQFQPLEIGTWKELLGFTLDSKPILAPVREDRLPSLKVKAIKEGRKG